MKQLKSQKRFTSKKKYTPLQLHKNFILIHEFLHPTYPIKKWVLEDKTYTGQYHDNWNTLMEIIDVIGNKTDYELVMYSGESYWNKFGENPLEREFEGYQNILNIYEAVVEFVKAYNKNPEKF